MPPPTTCPSRCGRSPDRWRWWPAATTARLDEQADEFIGFAVDGCQRMQTLIDGFLAFSRAGRLEGDIVPTDANMTLRAVLGALRPTLDHAHVTVVVDRLPVVMAEPTQGVLMLCGGRMNHGRQPGPTAPGPRRGREFGHQTVCPRAVRYRSLPPAPTSVEGTEILGPARRRGQGRMTSRIGHVVDLGSDSRSTRKPERPWI